MFRFAPCLRPCEILHEGPHGRGSIATQTQIKSSPLGPREEDETPTTLTGPLAPLSESSWKGPRESRYTGVVGSPLDVTLFTLLPKIPSSNREGTDPTGSVTTVLTFTSLLYRPPRLPSSVTYLRLR